MSKRSSGQLTKIGRPREEEATTSLTRTVLLAGGSPGESAYLKIHEPHSGKADHLAQHIGIRRLFQRAAQVQCVVGRLWFSGLGVEVATGPYRKPR